LSWVPVYNPFSSGTAGHDTSAAPEGETVSRGATNLVVPTAGLCGLPTRQGTGSYQLERTDPEKYHALRGKQPTTTHRRKWPSAPHGGRGWDWAWRQGPTVYELCSFRLKDSSVTSVTLQRAFAGGAQFRPRGFGDGGARHGSRPRGRNRFTRRNDPSRTDCGALRPPYTARHWAGSTNTH
jgi:hypothetical protein